MLSMELTNSTDKTRHYMGLLREKKMLTGKRWGRWKDAGNCKWLIKVRGGQDAGDLWQCAPGVVQHLACEGNTFPFIQEQNSMFQETCASLEALEGRSLHMWLLVTNCLRNHKEFTSINTVTSSDTSEAFTFRHMSSYIQGWGGEANLLSIREFRLKTPSKGTRAA